MSFDTKNERMLISHSQLPEFDYERRLQISAAVMHEVFHSSPLLAREGEDLVPRLQATARRRTGLETLSEEIYEIVCGNLLPNLYVLTGENLDDRTAQRRITGITLRIPRPPVGGLIEM